MKNVVRKRGAFLVSMVLLLSIMLAGGCSGKAQRASAAQKPEVVKAEGWTEVGKDIYVFSSSFYLANSVLVTSGNEGILVDTGENEEDRKKIESFLKDRKLKLRNIIITHLHSDHSGNLDAFKTEGMEPITPKNAGNGQEIVLGDKTLKVKFTEGHFAPKGHLSVEIPEKSILIAGDIICNNILPPIAAGGKINDLLATLRELESENYTLIIPGHGDIADNKLIFERQFGYLENAKKKAEEVIAAGGRLSDLGKIKLEDCIGDTSYLYKERLEYWHKASLEAIYMQLKAR